METQLHFQLIQSAHKTKHGSNKRTFPEDEKWQKLYMIKKNTALYWLFLSPIIAWSSVKSLQKDLESFF